MSHLLSRCIKYSKLCMYYSMLRLLTYCRKLEMKTLPSHPSTVDFCPAKLIKAENSNMTVDALEIGRTFSETPSMIPQETNCLRCCGGERRSETTAMYVNTHLTMSLGPCYHLSRGTSCALSPSQ